MYKPCNYIIFVVPPQFCIMRHKIGGQQFMVAHVVLSIYCCTCLAEGNPKIKMLHSPTIINSSWMKKTTPFASSTGGLVVYNFYICIYIYIHTIERWWNMGFIGSFCLGSLNSQSKIIHFIWLIHLTLQRTKMTGWKKATMIDDAFPIKHGNFPLAAMLVFVGKTRFC